MAGKNKNKGYDLRDLTSTISSDFKWLKSTKFMETYWERHQRKQIDFYEISELYHENTKMRRCISLQVGLSTDVFMKKPNIIEATTKIFKSYPTHPRIKLPLEGLEIDPSLGEAIVLRRSSRNFTGEPVMLVDLAKILYYSNGITCRLEFEERFTKKHLTQFFRAAPAGGALYPIEMYVGVNHVEGLAPGIYHYNVFEHSLEILREEKDFTSKFTAAFPIHPDYVRIDMSALVLILSAVLGRPKAKYGPRGYRFALQESGHVTQNALLVATACGLGSVALAGFYDDDLNEWLDVDGVNEAVVYATAIGKAHAPAGIPVNPSNFRKIVELKLD